jgi:hypothetical protein
LASDKTVGAVCPEKGNALFARTRIARGEVIAVFGGRIIQSNELALLPAEQRRLVMQVEEDAFLYSEVEGSADWINHSCAPNAGLLGQIVLVAMRDIATGEEICFDYAMTDGSPYDEFECACRTPTCRGRFTGADWSIPVLWDRYDGHFSPYLARRIEALRAALAGKQAPPAERAG